MHILRSFLFVTYVWSWIVRVCLYVFYLLYVCFFSFLVFSVLLSIYLYTYLFFLSFFLSLSLSLVHLKKQHQTTTTSLVALPPNTLTKQVAHGSPKHWASEAPRPSK